MNVKNFMSISNFCTMETQKIISKCTLKFILILKFKMKFFYINIYSTVVYIRINIF